MTRAGDGRPTPKDPAELQAQTEQTRAELSQTLSALADKADVKGRVSEAAGKAKGRAAKSASAAADKASSAASTAANKTADVSKNVAAEVSADAERAAEMAGHGIERVRRNPLPFVGVVLGALAVGAVAAIFAIRKRRR